MHPTTYAVKIHTPTSMLGWQHTSLREKSMKEFLFNLVLASLMPLAAILPAKAETLSFSGTLSTSDLQLDDGSYYDLHTFSGRAGDSVRIDLISDDFDTYLILLDPSGDPIAENDDVGRSNANSQLTLELPSTGEYVVVANSYNSNGRGQYTLSILNLSEYQQSSGNLDTRSFESFFYGCGTGCRVVITRTSEIEQTSLDRSSANSALFQSQQFFEYGQPNQRIASQRTSRFFAICSTNRLGVGEANSTAPSPNTWSTLSRGASDYQTGAYNTNVDGYYFDILCSEAAQASIASSSRIVRSYDSAVSLGISQIFNESLEGQYEALQNFNLLTSSSGGVSVQVDLPPNAFLDQAVTTIAAPDRRSPFDFFFARQDISWSDYLKLRIALSEQSKSVVAISDAVIEYSDRSGAYGQQLRERWTTKNNEWRSLLNSGSGRDLWETLSYAAEETIYSSIAFTGSALLSGGKLAAAFTRLQIFGG
jgi:hypothetical protein